MAAADEDSAATFLFLLVASGAKAAAPRSKGRRPRRRSRHDLSAGAAESAPAAAAGEDSAATFLFLLVAADAKAAAPRSKGRRPRRRSRLSLVVVDDAAFHATGNRDHLARDMAGQDWRGEDDHLVRDVLWLGDLA
jgi:hypothetical protein